MITKAFKEAVKNKNISLVRIMMKDSLIVDPSLKTFNKMNTLASQIEGLYDDFDNRELRADESLWDSQYLDLLMVQLLRNFSRERIRHIKQIVKKIYPMEVPNSKRYRDKVVSTKGSSRKSYQQQKNKDLKQLEIRLEKNPSKIEAIKKIAAKFKKEKNNQNEDW